MSAARMLYPHAVAEGRAGRRFGDVGSRRCGWAGGGRRQEMSAGTIPYPLAVAEGRERRPSGMSVSAVCGWQAAPGIGNERAGPLRGGLRLEGDEV